MLLSFIGKLFFLYCFVFLNLVSAQSVPIDTIPFELGANKRVFTYCKVNDSDSLLYLIDTGASAMVINTNSEKDSFTMVFDREIINRGSTGSHKVKLSLVNKLYWGHQQIDSLRFITIPYKKKHWDGIIGLNTLRQFVLEIDYPKNLIYLYNKDSFKTEIENSIRIEFIKKVPMIRANLKIEDEWFEIVLELDLGSTRSLDLNTPFVNKHRLIKKMPSISSSNIIGSSGKTVSVVNVIFDSLQIGTLRLDQIKGGLNQLKTGMDASDDFDGALGSGFLWNYRLIFDFGKNDFYLTRR